MRTIDLIASTMRSWHEAKVAIQSAGAISNEVLHVALGMAIWLLAALLIARRLGAICPIFIVIAVAVWNEVVDLEFERWPDRNLQYREGITDLVLTIFLPALLIVGIRVRHALARRSRPAS